MKEVDGGGSGTHQQEVPLCDICEDEHADIRAIRALDTRSTDPAASTAAGEGLTVAKVGEAAEFVVTAMEVGSGKQQRDGGDEVVASLVQQHAADKGDGGGGGAATTNPKRGKRKRGGCSGTGNSRSRTAKKNKTGSATSRLVPANPYTTVGDNGDGTYNCSYTLPEGADEVGGGKWQLGVLLNGRHIGGSPFAIEVRPSATITNWVFGSVVAAECHLSEGGAVATKLEDESEAGTIADGGGCTPMIHGLHFWELEVVKNEADLDFAPGGWFFGVCRPGIDVDDGEAFHTRDDTWMMYQSNNPSWHMYCSSCTGTGMALNPKPMMPNDSRIGLLLDLDNGGTLTMYWKGKPCGTIAAGLVGPLLPCIESYWEGKVVKIHGKLAPPP